MKYYNSINQEIHIGDKVVYENLTVNTKPGLYEPSVKITRNFEVYEVKDIVENKVYTSVVCERTVFTGVETKKINIKHVIKIS